MRTVIFAMLITVLHLGLKDDSDTRGTATLTLKTDYRRLAAGQETNPYVPPCALHALDLPLESEPRRGGSPMDIN